MLEAAPPEGEVDPEAAAIEAGAQGLEAGEDGATRFFTEPTELDAVGRALTGMGWTVKSASRAEHPGAPAHGTSVVLRRTHQLLPCGLRAVKAAPMPRRFNTAGPCRPDWHYMIPAERRLSEAPGLMEQMGYFVVHALRRAGKKTALRALAEQLTASGRYAVLYFSCESGEASGDDFASAQRAILREMRRRAELALPAELRPPPLALEGDESLLLENLSAWARACPRPVVLFLDEIDALRGQSLISVLRQLRSGFPDRPTDFPASVVLCGLRDVRDYKAASGATPTASVPPAPSTSSSSRSGWATSTGTRCASCTCSTPPTPASLSPRRPLPAPSS